VPLTLITGIAAPLLGGAIVAIITYFATRSKNRAEVRKLDAESDRIKAETTRILVDLNLATSDNVQKLPRRWGAAGSYPDDYEMGVDTTVAYCGTVSAYVKSKSDARGFGTLMQECKAYQYRGKRIKMSAYVKTQGVRDGAQLWLRVDGPEDTMMSFDNMSNRAICGTKDWDRYEIVLDVPNEAVELAYGVLLAGKGIVWVDNFEFEEVGSEAPTTDMIQGEIIYGNVPSNLDFEMY
jgi:hypothetical protein